jgi:hypothetical protein
VEHLLREIGTRHGHIRIGQAGLYIKVDDPMLLKELRSLKNVDIHFREELADTVALIAGSSVDALLKQLRHAGYLPVAVENSNGLARNRVEFDDEDDVFDYELPATPVVRAPENPPRIDWDGVLASEVNNREP